MTSTLTEKAVVGRRVEFAYYRSLHADSETLYTPGIITGTETAVNGKLLARVRLDGTRSTLTPPVDYEGLTYLDEVVPVPDLPMGRFTPERSDTNGLYEKEGVLFAAIGEDGEDWVFVTDDRAKAYAAAQAYATEVGVDLAWINAKDLQPYWAVFEWEPEDAESPWTVRWDAAEGDDQAIRIHYLPA
jgi:hypothetical protein